MALSLPDIAAGVAMHANSLGVAFEADAVSRTRRCAVRFAAGAARLQR